jgi:hypothetical protein
MQAKTNLVEVTTPMPDSSAEAAARRALAAVECLAIVTAEDYTSAANELMRVKGQYKSIDKEREQLKAPSLEGCRRVDDFFRAPLQFLVKAEQILKGKLNHYDRQQDAIRVEEQRRADAVARKERERIEAQALRAQASGKVDKAAALEQRAATIVAPIIDRTPPKVAGVQTREVWKYEVIDPAAVPREYTVVDESKIRRVVGALKGDTQIAGVRVWSEKNIAAASA